MLFITGIDWNAIKIEISSCFGKLVFAAFLMMQRRSDKVDARISKLEENVDFKLNDYKKGMKPII